MTDKVGASKPKQETKRTRRASKSLPKKSIVSQEVKKVVPDVAQNEVLSVVNRLKQLRIEKKFSLKTISEELRIRQDYLTAIEENIVEKLPEPAYTLGFIRSYANYLGLDGAKIVKEYKHEWFLETEDFENLDMSSSLLPEQTMPSRGLLVAAGVSFLIALILGWWLWGRAITPSANEAEDDATSVALQESVPLNAAAPALQGGPVNPDHSTHPNADDTHANVDDAHVSKVPTDGVSSGTGTQQTPAEDKGAAVESTEQPKRLEDTSPIQEPLASTLPNDLAEMTLYANGKSWIYVVHDHGKILVNRILEKGEAVTLPLGEDVYLSTGNIGVLSFELDGRRYKFVGKTGEVKRRISLEKNTLLQQVDVVE